MSGVGSTLEGVTLPHTQQHCFSRLPWEAGKVVVFLSLWSQKVLSRGVGIEVTMIELLCVKLNAKALKHVIPVSTHDKPLKEEWIFPYGPWGSERVSYSPKVAQLRGGRIWTKILDCSVYGYPIILLKPGLVNAFYFLGM